MVPSTIAGHASRQVCQRFERAHWSRFSRRLAPRTWPPSRLADFRLNLAMGSLRRLSSITRMSDGKVLSFGGIGDIAAG